MSDPLSPLADPPPAVESPGDLTAPTPAGNALKSREARSAAMLDAIPDLLFVISRDGIYLDFHASHADQLLVPPERFLGRHVQDIMPPPLASEFLKAFARLGSSNDSIELEYTLTMPDGDHLFEARLVPFEADSVLTIVRDITDREENESKPHLNDRALWETHALNQVLTGRLIASQEAEYQRIARELHDDLSQRLALLNVEIDRLDGSGLSGRELSDRVRHLSLQAGDIASYVHRLSHQLHPAKLQVLGLVGSIQSLCRDVAAQHTIQIDFSHQAIPDGVRPEVVLCVYRIVQEALHNIVKHSGASRASIRIVNQDGVLSAQIADHGKGFSPDVEASPGLGLVSMRERAAFLGGRMVIRSAPGEGTQIGALVPLDPAVGGPRKAQSA